MRVFLRIVILKFSSHLTHIFSNTYTHTHAYTQSYGFNRHLYHRTYLQTWTHSRIWDLHIPPITSWKCLFGCWTDTLSSPHPNLNSPSGASPIMAPSSYFHLLQKFAGTSLSSFHAETKKALSKGVLILEIVLGVGTWRKWSFGVTGWFSFGHLDFWNFCSVGNLTSEIYAVKTASSSAQGREEISSCKLSIHWMLLEAFSYISWLNLLDIPVI